MEMHGVVHGQRVELEDRVPGLEGRRVRVRLEVVDEERKLSSAEQSELWQQWVESGPQGPIEEDEDGWP